MPDEFDPAGATPLRPSFRPGERDVRTLSLVARACALPFVRLGTVWHIFWPALIVLAASVTAMQLVSAHLGPAVRERDLMAISTGLVGITIWQSLITASGLVRWHRHLVDDAQPERGRLWLDGSEWWFYLRWVVVGSVAYLTGLALILVLTAGRTAAGLDYGDWSALDQTAEALAGLLGLFIGVAALALFWPRLALSLAAVAVDRPTPLLGQRRLALSLAIAATASVCLIVEELLVLLPGALGLPTETFATRHPGTIALTTLTFVAYQFSLIAFAAMLSLFLREMGGAGARPPSAQATASP